MILELEVENRTRTIVDGGKWTFSISKHRNGKKKNWIIENSKSTQFPTEGRREKEERAVGEGHKIHFLWVGLRPDVFILLKSTSDAPFLRNGTLFSLAPNALTLKFFKGLQNSKIQKKKL